PRLLVAEKVDGFDVVLCGDMDPEAMRRIFPARDQWAAGVDRSGPGYGFRQQSGRLFRGVGSRVGTWDCRNGQLADDLVGPRIRAVENTTAPKKPRRPSGEAHHGQQVKRKLPGRHGVTSSSRTTQLSGRLTRECRWNPEGRQSRGRSAAAPGSACLA